MSLTVTTHVNSRGRTREMLAFYADVFGGDPVVASYGDIHQVEPGQDPDDVAFGTLRSPSGFVVAAYDVQPSKPYDAGSNPFYVVLHGTDADEVRRVWDGLAAGGTVLVPIGPAAFSPLYGMLTDRFGVTWIIDAEAPQG